MMKLMIVVGTRPEIIRLSEIIKLCDRCFDLVLVHTGQNYDFNLNDVFFNEFGLRKPDYYLDSPGKNLGETVGNVISRTYDVIQREKPDALLILGDTNSCLSAYSAKRCKVPIFHMEAGNRCFDYNVPEEINRKVVDHISDVNLAYSENARRYLINEGIKNDFLYVVGSPMREVVKSNFSSIRKSKIVEKLGLKRKDYFVVSLHREENIDIDANFLSLVESLNAVAREYCKPVIFSTHPRTKKKIEGKGIIFDKLVVNIDALGYFDYVRLQKDSFCVLSDSGTLAEESAILNFPAVSIRTSTERPEAFDSGILILGGLESKNVLDSIKITTKLRNPSVVNDYQDENVSEKVVKIIQSYTGIVNLRTWRK